MSNEKENRLQAGGSRKCTPVKSEPKSSVAASARDEGETGEYVATVVSQVLSVVKCLEINC
ncbi:hypothetical protein CS8_023180 [Cupriavidus sp. 8B]